MSYWVYVHTCKANGKRYVGCTTRVKPEYRWVKGKGYQNNDHFYRAILKYGWDNFEHEVFEVDSAEEMYRKEIELISFYHSNDPEYGYNNSTGGEHSGLGCRCSEESRKRRSEVQKKVHADPEYRKRISETSKGRIHTEETKRRIAETNRRRAKDPEFRRKMSEAQKKVQKKVHADPEYRKRISETLKGRPKPRVKISLPDGTILEVTKSHIVRNYVNKGKKFEYVD